MSIRAYSNLASHFQNMTHTTRLRTSMESLNKVMSTGQRDDLQESLGVNRARLAHLDQTLHTLNAGLETTQLYGVRLDQQQLALETIETRRQEVQDVSLGVTFAPSVSELALVTSRGEASFTDMISALNETFGGRALFSGVNADTIPLPSADTILADLRATINFAQPPADVIADIRHYFEDPAGAFETTHYQGGDPAGTEVRLSETARSGPAVTALDAGVRIALSSAAAVALAGDAPLTVNERGALLRETQALSLESANLATHRGMLGVEQERVATIAAELTGRKTAIEMERNTLTSADLFETAGELQAVQAQLEAHFSIIARQSRLSLLEYL